MNMKINSFENLMKYISKYKSTPKKISKVKDKFNEYLNLCNEQNIIDYINELKSITQMENTLYLQKIWNRNNFKNNANNGI